MVPLGPVAVFGASNFPLAFSTAGGDTASALAAGCPVVVKGHPAHPRTGELVARAVTRAVAAHDLPAGVFSFLLATDGPSGIDLGQELVRDPRIKAVGFTGSRGGGLALVAAAAARPEPIPVYAEMSSINPVVVLPGALADGDVVALATAYVGSLTLGSGQFCTNPGLLFLPAGDDGDAFLAAVSGAVADAAGQRMLTEGIARAYEAGTATLRDTDGVRLLAQGSDGGELAPAPQVVETATLASPVTDEVFGASGVVVRYADTDALVPHLEQLEGSSPRPSTTARRRRRGPAAAPGAGGHRRPDPLQRLADRGRGVPRDGARRPVPGDVGRAQHLGRHARDRAVPAPGLLPERARRPASGRRARRQPVGPDPPGRRRAPPAMTPTIAPSRSCPSPATTRCCSTSPARTRPFFTRNIAIVTDSDGRNGSVRCPAADDPATLAEAAA